MKPEIIVDTASQTPIYRQLIAAIQQLIQAGNYQSGDSLPSINELSQSLAISKETVTKAYSILREKGLIESAHGKGFYVLDDKEAGKIRVLMLFDKLSTYKFVLYRSFMEHAGDQADVTIHLHNQELEIFERLLEDNLGNYDYYIITPHFPIDSKTQSHVIRLLKKIPNRKLIVLDRNIESLSGKYGSVYQDFSQDAYQGLQEGLTYLKKYDTIQVVSSPGGLYGMFIKEGIGRFCREHNLPHAFLDQITADTIRPGNVYIILNSQLDVELIEIIRMAKNQELTIGSDIGIISYNEAPINEIILDGLTVLSTDFQEMGRLAAEMIKSGKLSKIRNTFGLILRKTL